ncbi:hypothetical protein GCM10023185_34830 [Hymenobacter saemangeumensis]|uniref:Tetratricopeptide repeat protein n=1 Tax=Hymenobacter saemangeumensis TaxID=1084522 RepID=A0ABP8IPS0_9BACT
MGFCLLGSMAQAQSPSAQVLLDQGLELFKADDNAGAAAKYEQVLASVPGNIAALMGLMYCYMNLHRDTELVSVCEKLLQAPGELPLATAYSYYGLGLSHLKRYADAEQAFAKGAAQYPDDFALHFNRGNNLIRLSQPAAAKQSYCAAVVANPRHFRSHLNLSVGMFAEGDRVPAVLALGRYLELDAQGQQAAARAGQFDQALMQGVRRQDEGHVNVTLPSKSVDALNAGTVKPDDFANLEVGLTLAAAKAVGESKGKSSHITLVHEVFVELCRLLAAQAPGQRTGFAWQYYAPYYVELEKQGHAPAFVHLTHTAQGEPEVQLWLAAHKADVAKFQQWSAAYAWPKGLR